MTKIIQRHDTAANWSTVNPILALGEMGVETDTNKFKFGDGTTTYNELPYAAGEGGGTGGSGTILTSIDGNITYDKLAIGESLIVDTGDIPWTNPQMNSNSQDGYVASASSDDHTLDAQIWKAFDKDTTTPEDTWYTGPVSPPQWIMLECPEPIRLTSCMIMNEVSSPVNLRSGYIQGSNDGSNFDTLYTITDRPDTTGLQVTYTFDNNRYYKYLRVYCIDKWSNSDGISIQEIEFSGYVKDEGGKLTLNTKVDSYSKEETDNLLNAKQDKLTAGDGIDISLKYTDVIYPAIALPYTFTNENTTVFTSNQMLDDGATISFKVSQESIGSFIGIKESVENSGIAFQVRDNIIYSNYWVNDSTGEVASSSPISITQGIYYKVKYHNSSLLELFYSLDGMNYIAIGTWTGYGANFYNKNIFMLVNPGWYGGGETCTVTKLEQVNPTSSSVLTISSTVSGQDVKTFTGYSDTGTLVLKSINGVIQWVAET